MKRFMKRFMRQSSITTGRFIKRCNSQSTIEHHQGVLHEAVQLAIEHITRGQAVN